MAELTASQNGKAAGRKKLNPRVDLTAMVDLAFLLITFFMLTTSLSKDKALDVVKPVPITERDPKHEYPASRTMTILLGGTNKAVCYMGEAKNGLMQIENITSLGKVILANKKLVAETHQTVEDKVLLVIIKPTDKSNYKNFVDVLDEMKINNVLTYAIDDKYLLKEELEFMKVKKI